MDKKLLKEYRENKMLEWFYENGQWEALSSVHDDGSNFRWVINVLPDGNFTNTKSSKELLSSVFFGATFMMVADRCQEQEYAIIDEMLNKSNFTRGTY